MTSMELRRNVSISANEFAPFVAQRLELRAQGLPIAPVCLTLPRFLHGEGRDELGLVAAQCKLEARSPGNEPPATLTVGSSDGDEKLGRAELAQPETNVSRGSGFSPPEEVRLHEPANHRPVFVPLCLLRLK